MTKGAPRGAADAAKAWFTRLYTAQVGQRGWPRDLGDRVDERRRASCAEHRPVWASRVLTLWGGGTWDLPAPSKFQIICNTHSPSHHRLLGVCQLDWCWPASCNAPKGAHAWLVPLVPPARPRWASHGVGQGSSAGLKLRGPMVCCLNLAEGWAARAHVHAPPENRREGTRRRRRQRGGQRGGPNSA